MLTCLGWSANPQLADANPNIRHKSVENDAECMGLKKD